MNEKQFYIILGIVITLLIPIGFINAESEKTRERIIESEYGKSARYVIEQGDEYCTSDCSGHSAGYEYAAQEDICDTQYGNSSSSSFNRGVRQWSEKYCE